MNDTWRYKLELAPPSLQVRFCLYSYLDFLPPFLCPSCPSLSSHSSQSSSLCVVPSLSPPPFWLPASIPSFFSRSRYLNAPPPSLPPFSRSWPPTRCFSTWKTSRSSEGGWRKRWVVHFPPVAPACAPSLPFLFRPTHASPPASRPLLILPFPLSLCPAFRWWNASGRCGRIPFNSPPD